jgi:hypothetical protein
VIVGSVQVKAASPFRVLAAAIAVRSSVTCVDFSTVVVAIRGLSVKLALAENVAETVTAALSVTVHVPVPEQPPVQPVKVEPAAGVAVKATAVPLANEAAHVAPQDMPAGLLVTVPAPEPPLLTVSVKVCPNVAVTVVAALSVTVQGPAPEQPPPLQPVNAEPAAGAAVRVTAVPLANEAAHVAPQAMPVGALVTVPVPVPDLVTVSVKDCNAKLAVTVVAALVAMVQERVPAQPPPLQPVKVEPAAGVAVRAIEELAANEAEHVLPQAMPAGALVIVPVPAPDLVTVTMTDCSANVAETDAAAFIVTVQAPLPKQAPLHPVKPDPASGVTVKLTTVPLAKAAEQLAPQEMPAGELVMVPVPVPILPTLSVKLCSAKVAVTVVAALRVTLHVPVPEQLPPDQPEKVEPAAGVAVSVTAVPLV